MKATRWSDPATWPGRKVPRAGDKVTIANGKEVILDVSPPALGGLTIEGKLRFADNADLELTTEWIMLYGELEIGTEASPHTHKATLTFTDNVPDENVMGMGDRGIMIAGGTLNLHGDRTNSWTKLARTARAGSDSIEVLDAAGWRVGDEIVLASTDFDPRQAERRTISAIHRNTITLDRKLEYMHFGEITFGVDERGEVGLLTRNIRIQASADAEQSYFGGHVMAMPTSRMFVSGVEFNRMGQHLHLARYPIHWHLVSDAKGQYIRNSAIHDTFNRCVTVHGTNHVLVENNVTFNTVGHCFFLEDGIETGNQYIRNLGIMTKCHPTKPCVPTNLAAGRPVTGPAGQNSSEVLIPSDNTASTFWITNPDNVYRDNVAAGSDQIGFWLALPAHPTGAYEGSEISKSTWPRRMALREFKGNVAHSNFDGLMFDRGPEPDGHFTVAGGHAHIALANPADPNSPQVETVIEDFTGYKNRNGAIWSRGELKTFRNLKLADNAIGFTHASGNLGRSAFTSRVIDSLFVGESDNIGNPGTPGEIAYGRSLPYPEMPDYPIRGYEFYDFRHEVDNVTFVNFQDNATRKTGAISYLMYTSFGISSNNTIEHAKFINAKPVYFPPMERKWAADFGSRAGWMSAVFRDKDGAVSGVPNAYILINDGVAIDDKACEIKPAWNAAVCRGDIGRVRFGGGGGGFRAPGARPTGAGAASSGSNAGPVAIATRAGSGPAAGANAAGSRAPGSLAGGAGGAAQPPVVLSRNGRVFTLAAGEANVRAGTEIKVITERPSVSLNVRELDSGSWVIFELPGFTSAASGVQQNSLKALRKADTTSYYKGKGSLWVKVVSGRHRQQSSYRDSHRDQPLSCAQCATRSGLR
ncbi:MAG: transmembrane domain-containing protein [Steroidobacteraceae bacterium]|nr:transmembrane domain-containing protein [Steroidobacteraceae bacterium]